MDLAKLKNNTKKSNKLQSYELADKIHLKLHEGSLFDIHQMLQAMKEEEKKCLVGVFIEKFNFDFSEYI